MSYRNGSAVLINDVARVMSGVENAQVYAAIDTTPAIIVDIRRQSDANTIKVVDSIKALLPQLQASLPASIQVQVLTDRTVTIRASVEDVEFELVLTIGLVVMVIFLFFCVPGGPPSFPPWLFRYRWSARLPSCTRSAYDVVDATLFSTQHRPRHRHSEAGLERLS